MSGFSVLISVYKKDKSEYLKKALESIYEKQTLKPNEIVIVLDGILTKELYKIVSEFKVKHKAIVRIIPLTTNVGLGEALKLGSYYCSKEFIFRMDSDDISHPRRFEKQIRYMQNNPDIDVLGTNIKEFKRNYKAESMRVREVPRNHDEIVKMAKRRNPMNHVTVCIKKTALEDTGGYETLLLLEDYYLWLKMINNNNKLENMRESLVYVRTDEDFSSKRSSRIRIKGWRELQDYMYKNNMITKFDVLLNMVYINVFIRTPSMIKKILYKFFLRK